MPSAAQFMQRSCSTLMCRNSNACKRILKRKRSQIACTWGVFVGEVDTHTRPEFVGDGAHTPCKASVSGGTYRDGSRGGAFVSGTRAVAWNVSLLILSIVVAIFVALKQLLSMRAQFRMRWAGTAASW